MKVLHLFAGAGGSHLAGEMLGWESIGSVEIEPYCQAVIKHHYPNEAIHGDIRSFSATHLAGYVDGICGGFPCQDISSAGKGAGITGEQSGLWKEFARIIDEAHPQWAFIENSPLLRTRGLEVILDDLAKIGYDAEWGTYRASDVGAPHRRDRMWILAYSKEMLCDGSNTGRCKVSEPRNHRVPQRRSWASEPQLGRVADGVANRVDRLAALGNGWVPAQAAEAFRQLWVRAKEC